MMESKKIKVYSLNLSAYLIGKGYEPETMYDEDEDLVLFLFNDTCDISKAITEYRTNKEIQNFIGAFKVVRKMISSHKSK